MTKKLTATKITKTFCRYRYPGFFFSEDIVVEVKNREPDIEYLKKNKGCYSFEYYDQDFYEVDGITTAGNTSNYSGTYFVNGKVYTVAELKQAFPDKEILISNIDQGDPPRRGVCCRAGNWQFFGKDDKVFTLSEG